MAIAWLPGPAGTRRRVAKLSVEEPDAAEPARPDLWEARVSNDPGLPDRATAHGGKAVEHHQTRCDAASTRGSLPFLFEGTQPTWPSEDLNPVSVISHRLSIAAGLR